MRSVARAASFTVLAALAACEHASPPSEAAQSRPAAATMTPGAEIAAVTWPPADRVDRGALRVLPKAAAVAAGSSSVPVLVPTRRELLAAPVIVTKEHWTSFWAKTPELAVSISMTRLARRHGGISPMTGPRTVRGLPAFITTNEGVWSATWMENGVSYTLDVECASPDAPSCASDDLLLKLASELAYVGGAGAPRTRDIPR